MNPEPVLSFDNSYARLGTRFYTRQSPEPVSAPGLIRVNHALAGYLNIDPHWLESEAGVAVIAGNRVPAGGDPIATVYAGHQFGGWNPQLGDGRAHLLGELIATDGSRFDIQLKGSGRTAYSRGGDGRAPLGPVLREYIVSEAMAVLGVPTTRVLAAVTTGERVIREGPLPGAVLARVAKSHIRIGTFQYFAARQDHDALESLVKHVIQRHYPHAAQADDPVRVMLEGVVARQAVLIARWQLLGFIHGVMNTDNMLLSGETIDYGPCAFMDKFDPATVFSSIDHGGRYAYRNQPHIAHWNLGRFAQTLLPLMGADQDKAIASAQAAIDVFPERYLAAYQNGMLKKLGIKEFAAGDDQLIQDLLTLMNQEKTDFTLTFRRLSDLAGQQKSSQGGINLIFELPTTFTSWLDRWRLRLANDPQDKTTRQSGMYDVNPIFIARNHLVEEAIDAAINQQDLEPFHTLVDILARPGEFDSKRIRYATPPRPDQVVRQTFCGT